MLTQEWEERIKEVRDLVAKGYSVETPRWMVSTKIRGLMRTANEENNTEAYDLLVFELERWNQKQ